MTDKISSPGTVARSPDRNVLSEPEGKARLAAAGLVVPRGAIFSVSDAETLADLGLNFPVAVKAVSRSLAHKSESGGVVLNVTSMGDVRAACRTIQSKFGGTDLDGFLVEEMAPPGHELIVGGLRYQQFGPVIMVGLGGVFTEVFGDTSFRICPITRGDASEMLDDLQAAPVLAGARGGITACREAIIDALLRLGGETGLLLGHEPTIDELDINPLIVSASGAVVADTHIVTTSEAVSSPRHGRGAKTSDALMEEFKPLFNPATVAVAGASAKARNRANVFIDQLLSYGYERENLYAIHPTAKSIDGVPAYSSISELPGIVDYAYIAVPAARVAALLDDASGRVKFAHVISSGFAEVGETALQDELVRAAERADVRVLGPNCNGGHSPRGKLTFCYDCAPEAGSVGILLQSGGLGVDTIRRGNHRGLRFSGVMTVGNCADIGVEDLLEFYLSDTDTRVIGMYLESVRDGRFFFECLRQRTPAKPVVILRGGASARGAEAASSHTGALASSGNIWQALAKQAGVVLTVTLDEFINALLVLQCCRPRHDQPTQRATLVGNGGGTSVLGVDAFAHRGIDILPFDGRTVDQLESLNLGAGASYTNPVDLPQPILVGRQGRDCECVLRTILGQEEPQALVLHVNLSVVLRHSVGSGDPINDLLDAVERIQTQFPGKAHIVLVLRSDGNVDFEQAKTGYRARALELGIPTYDEISDAAHAISVISEHEAYLSRR